MKVIFLLFSIFCSIFTASTFANEIREIQWDDLMPPDYAELLREQKKNESKWLDIFRWGDDSKQAKNSFDSLQAKLNSAPIVSGLDNQRIKLAGFIVPLDFDFDTETFNDFLLVPYFGACIHVPPPPSNQIVHISVVNPLKKKWLDNAVWVSGILKTESVSNEYGSAGYSMKNAHIDEFKE